MFHIVNTVRNHCCIVNGCEACKESAKKQQNSHKQNMLVAYKENQQIGNCIEIRRNNVNLLLAEPFCKCSAYVHRYNHTDEEGTAKLDKPDSFVAAVTENPFAEVNTGCKQNSFCATENV